MKKEDFQNSQQGTGSAENKGSDRNEQKNRMTHLDKKERKDIAQEFDLGRKRITDLNDIGALSGRDDYAGGDNDGMSDQSTNQRTDR